MAEAQTPDLEGMLKSLLDDPTKMAQLRTVMQTLGSAGEESGSDNSDGETPSAPAGSLLGGMLSNPALLSQLPTIMEMLHPLMNSSTATAAGADSTPARESGSDESKPTSALPATKHKPPDHRTALLLALKPYLSDGRREMIDYIVNLSRLGDLLNR